MGRTYHVPTPQTFPILKPEHTSTCLVAYRTFGAHWKIALQPLVGDPQLIINEIRANVKRKTRRCSSGSSTHPIFVFDDISSNSCEGRPLTVVEGFGSASLVGFELANCGARRATRLITAIKYEPRGEVWQLYETALP